MGWGEEKGMKEGGRKNVGNGKVNISIHFFQIKADVKINR